MVHDAMLYGALERGRTLAMSVPSPDSGPAESDGSAPADGLTPIERDAALMQRVKDGDPRASREVVDTHLGPVHSFAWRMLGDAHEAEDVAQEAFLKLWKQARKWKPKAQIGTWLRRVAYNACIDRLRKRRPTEAVEDVPLEDSRPNPEDVANAERVAAQVKAAVAALPERQRAALALVHYEGLGNIETAEVLETTVEAVESLLGRARRALKKELASLHADLMET